MQEYLAANKLSGAEIEVGSDSLRSNLPYYIGLGFTPKTILFSGEAGMPVGKADAKTKEAQQALMKQYAEQFSTLLEKNTNPDTGKFTNPSKKGSTLVSRL